MVAGLALCLWGYLLKCDYPLEETLVNPPGRPRPGKPGVPEVGKLGKFVGEVA